MATSYSCTQWNYLWLFQEKKAFAQWVCLFVYRGVSVGVMHSFINRKADSEESALLLHTFPPTGEHSPSTQGEVVSRYMCRRQNAPEWAW